MEHDGLAEELKESLEKSNEEYVQQWLAAEQTHHRFLESKQKTREFFGNCINLQQRILAIVGNVTQHPFDYIYSEDEMRILRCRRSMPLFSSGDKQLSWIFADFDLQLIVERTRKTREIVRPRRILRDTVVAEEYYTDEIRHPEAPYHAVAIDFKAADSASMPPSSLRPLNQEVYFTFPKHMRDDVDNLEPWKIDDLFPFRKDAESGAPQHVLEYQEMSKAVTLIEEALANQIAQP